MLNREECADLDRDDPLAHMRDRFILPEGVIYLDGNSLGPLPKAAVAMLSHTVEQEWGQGLIRSWDDAGWFDLPQRLGDRLGRLIGAAPGQVVACDGTSINLYKTLRAALSLRPDRRTILAEAGSFPTDLYIIEGAAEGHRTRLLGRDGDTLDDLLDDDVAVVVLSHVDYRSGALLDMRELTAKAHRAGALVIWDLCHSAGVVPVELDGCEADFAVGCSYKYLNGGPGAPAFLYAAHRHHEASRHPLTGWWGHAAPFAFEREFRPQDGIRRFLTGTQPILGLKGVEAALQLYDDVDLAALRAKSRALGDSFIALVEQHPDCAALQLASPRDSDVRGSQVAFTFPHGYAVIRAMIEQGVIGDFREPGLMRFGLAPLYLRHTDLFDAVEIMADCLRRQVWTDPKYQTRAAVT
ncbi:kynureninase [Paracoccus jeotgali]|uniref:kynureninase n=1 Tax=Paracoccus jeotgali TaxID=2065379 RepID=UPI0028B0A64A|nr:kynureninase [Paracoccus jeotgali]